MTIETAAAWVCVYSVCFFLGWMGKGFEGGEGVLYAALMSLAVVIGFLVGGLLKFYIYG